MTEPETLRDAWYVAAYTSELEEKGMISTTLLGEPIVIYGKTDGSPVALEDRCVHRLAPLSLGRSSLADFTFDCVETPEGWRFREVRGALVFAGADTPDLGKAAAAAKGVST